MRPKIVITLLLAGLAGIALVFFLKSPVQRPQPVVASVAQPATNLAQEAAAPIRHPSPPASAPMAPAPVVQPKQSAPVPGEVVNDEADKVQEQIDRLDDLESNDDDASLQAILKELTNTNKDVRHEAVEATIQFGNRDAIPVLNDLAASTQDPDEKKELLDAAEFLALPTLTEAKAQQQQEKAQGGGTQQ
jgi:hypothetical protein